MNKFVTPLLLQLNAQQPLTIMKSLNWFKLIHALDFNGPLMVNLDTVIVYANQ